MLTRIGQCSLARLVLMGVMLVSGLEGCRNPAQSTLPPSAISEASAPLPPLPKGDVFVDETVPTVDTLIDVGDSLDVVIRRGAGEEKFASVVRESGRASLAFVEVQVAGLTASQAEAKVQEAFTPYMREPRAQVTLKKKALRVKRVFVFGDVKKPGMYPMPRNMTVVQAVAAAESYNETALLEEIRVVRGNLQHPEVYTADLSRLYTYGDWSRNLALEENDIVFVPREHLGDATEAAKKITPVVGAALAPFYPAIIIPTFFPGAVIR
ncbi:MAG: SLBB domain-containing protein [Nitrospiraceae bacterium]|nr:SLBB domain-containing protein [Nitrospiraceae bacterium]